jgi:molybdenum cofactor guanylyltransferase
LFARGEGEVVKFQGIVLAGGKSSRFGTDKALACVKGFTMIERAINLLSSLDLTPVVITNETRDYSFLNYRIERDLIPGKGPLGGLYTACRLFKQSSLVVLTCDMPNLTRETLKRLLDHHDRAHKTTLFKINRNRFQPFPGIYEPSLIDLIKKALDAGDLSMQNFLQQAADINPVAAMGAQEIFLNVNLPFQMREVSQRAGTLESASLNQFKHRVPE